MKKNHLKQNKIEYRKELSKIIKNCKSNAKPSECYYCGEKTTSFCNSHSIPAFCLKNISTSGEVGCLETLIDFPLLDNKKGIKSAGTFNLICRDCDSKIFADYENPDNYNLMPSPKMVAQIALKNNLRYISKRLLEMEIYKELGSISNLLDIYQNEIQYVNQLDLKDYKRGVQKAKRAIEKNWTDEYYICYYEKLNYVVPIAFQDSISIITGFNGEIINNVYEKSEKYEPKNIHICVFPLKKETILLMFINNKDNTYKNFYKQFKKLTLEDRLATLTYIMFAYSENVFFSNELTELIKKNAALVNAGNSTQNLFLSSPYTNALDFMKEQFDLSQRNDIINLLSEKYKIN